MPRTNKCYYCVEGSEVDYKDVVTLRHYVSERGKIQPRSRTSLCAKHQRMVTQAVKRARQLAMLPFAA